MARIPIPQAQPMPPGLTTADTIYAETHGKNKYGKNWKLTPKPRCRVLVRSAMMIVFIELRAVIPTTRRTVPAAKALKLLALAQITRPIVIRSVEAGYISPRPNISDVFAQTGFNKENTRLQATAKADEEAILLKSEMA